MELDEKEINNGYILSSYLVPEEVLINILRSLDPCTLKECRLVCRAWNNIIVFRDLEKFCSKSTHPCIDEAKRLLLNSRSHWYQPYSWLLKGVPFEKNLLRNNCGESELQYWETTKPGDYFRYTSMGYLFWGILPEPYAEGIPKHSDFGKHKTCFNTAYALCTKHQIIDLQERGFPAKLMDEFQPPITFSEWYSGREDYGCNYILRGYLLCKNRRVIKSIKIERTSREERTEWVKYMHVIDNYGPGVRYIKFEHEGYDFNVWSENCGCKMAGGVVKISFPSRS